MTAKVQKIAMTRGMQCVMTADVSRTSEPGGAIQTFISANGAINQLAIAPNLKNNASGGPNMTTTSLISATVDPRIHRMIGIRWSPKVIYSKDEEGALTP